MKSNLDDEVQREGLFVLLRQAVKSRGYTYAKLAEEMGMSELSIKRLFRDKDCKMSRLLEICSIIDLSIDELVGMQKRFKQTAEFLTLETEEALAADKTLFLLLTLLLSQLDIGSIKSLLVIDEATLYLQLRRLEKLGIIDLLPNDKYRFAISLPIRWRMGGPLSDLIKDINQRYISHCVDNYANTEYAFNTTSRFLTKNSAMQIQARLDEIRQEYDYLATQDQMFYQTEELHLHKLVFGMGPFSMSTILPELYTGKKEPG